MFDAISPIHTRLIAFHIILVAAVMHQVNSLPGLAVIATFATQGKCFSKQF